MRAALALLAGLLAAGPAFAFSRAYDGDWAVDARTTVGSCTPQAAGTVAIRDGKVAGASEPDVGVWGYVDSTGDISARFTTGQHVFRASGKMKKTSASGAWSSNTNYCGGVWTAHKAR